MACETCSSVAYCCSGLDENCSGRVAIPRSPKEVRQMHRPKCTCAETFRRQYSSMLSNFRQHQKHFRHGSVIESTGSGCISKILMALLFCEDKSRLRTLRCSYLCDASQHVEGYDQRGSGLAHVRSGRTAVSAVDSRSRT